MYIKVCGLTDAATARFAVERGADAIGLVMSAPSPRNVGEAVAAEIIAAVREANPGIDTVLVVREMPAEQAARTAVDLGVDVLQLHGRYAPDEFAAAARLVPRVWRATSLAQDPEVRAGERGEERLLLDGDRAGSGERWDLSSLAGNGLGTQWLLAGGLSPENVRAAVEQARPGGVDVSSGVESAPGIKDPARIARFIAAVRAAEEAPLP